MAKTALETALDAFGEDSPQVAVVRVLVARVSKQTSGFLTLEAIRSWLPDIHPDAVDRAVFWLASPATNLLQIRWQYLPPDDVEGEEDISPERVAYAMRRGKLPLEDGSTVTGFEPHLFPYFRAGPELLGELKEDD